jgi:hypothetical protein
MKKYRVYSIKGSPEYVIAKNREEAFKMLERDFPYSAVEVPLQEKECRIETLKITYEHNYTKAFADYGDFAINYTCILRGSFTDEEIKLFLKGGGSAYCRTKLNLFCEYNDFVGRFDDTGVFNLLRNASYNPYTVIETLIEHVMIENSVKKS